MRRDRGILVALALSAAAHGLLFLLPRPEPVPGSVTSIPPPLTVELVAAAPASQPAPAQPAPESRTEAAQPAPRPRAARPRRDPEPARMPEIPPPPADPLPAPPAPTPGAPPPVDMLAMIEARRAQRRAAEAAAKGSTQAAPADPTGQALQRNLRDLGGREGVGGVFQILRKGTRTAEFAFNGWKPDSQRRWREVIEVDAGPGGNVELAVVRRMIELIRGHYSGDFHWESHRLGRVIVLSARPEDQAGLEDFLLREFFGTPVINPRAGR